MSFSGLSKFVKDHQRGLMVFLICVYALYLRLVHLAQHNLWADEYWQLNAMEGPFVEFLKLLPQREFCSYLSGDYYLIYPFFKVFAYNKWGLAVPHIIATVLGFIFLYLICRQYYKTLLGYAVAFLIVCFNINLIIHATEIRTYAVMPTLGLMVLYYSQKVADLNTKMPLKSKCALGAFFILVIWWHAYGVLIFSLPFGFAVLNKLMHRQPNESAGVIITDMVKFVCIISCLAAPLWLYSVFGPHFKLLNAEGESAVGGVVFQFIPNPLENTVGFLKAIFGNLIGQKKLYFLLGGLVLAAVVPYRQKATQALFVVLTVIVPIGLLLFMDIRSDYWFIQRQFCWTMPFFAFFTGWVWDSLFVFTRAHFTARH